MDILNAAWTPCSEPPILEENEIHVWRAALVADQGMVEALRSVLAEAEIQRAERFVFARDRNRFIVARGLLRQLLGSYLGAAPGALRFQYTKYGKPFLEMPPSAPVLSFNLSHSDALALIAVAWLRKVGVDVERVRPDIQYDSIAKSVFSAREYTDLCGLPQEQRCAAFFAGWTRKEAYIKARGEGLSRPLDSFSVSLRPDEPVILECDDEADAGWHIHTLVPTDGYAAAVAVEGQAAHLKLYDIP